MSTTTTTPLRWTRDATRPPTLADLRAYALEVSKDLDPGSRYVSELLAVMDASSSVEDYLRRLHAPETTAVFKQDGSRVSSGERGFSWVDESTWKTMDPFEQTLSNLLTGETRMMWAGDGATDFARLPEVLRAVGATATRAASVLSIPCSTGKEPFSVVIAARRADLEVSVVGVDRQEAYVERARSGRLVPHHRDWQVADAERWLTWERREGAPGRAEDASSPSEREEPRSRAARTNDKDGSTRVTAELSSRCRFEQGDVLTGALPSGRFDLVLCRNLLGYFRGPSLEAAVRNVTARVRPGGVLLVDPFVTDGAEMKDARTVLDGLGFKRRKAGESFYDLA
jgi:chemotaxis methyl-accepting protein methylase